MAEEFIGSTIAKYPLANLQDAIFKSLDQAELIQQQKGSRHIATLVVHNMRADPEDENGDDTRFIIVGEGTTPDGAARNLLNNIEDELGGLLYLMQLARAVRWEKHDG